jgi:ankyrin repeat protein
LGNNKKQTPLHRVAFNEEIVRLLLEESGTDPNARDEDGQTAVHMAIWSKNPKILKTRLISKEVSVDVMDNNGRSPLWEAIATDQQETIGNILVERGANIGAFDRQGNSILHNAITRNLISGAIYLLKHGAPIEDINVDHQSALELAILHNCPPVIHEESNPFGRIPFYFLLFLFLFLFSQISYLRITPIFA